MLLEISTWQNYTSQSHEKGDRNLASQQHTIKVNDRVPNQPRMGVGLDKFKPICKSLARKTALNLLVSFKFAESHSR